MNNNLYIEFSFNPNSINPDIYYKELEIWKNFIQNTSNYNCNTFLNKVIINCFMKSNKTLTVLNKNPNGLGRISKYIIFTDKFYNNENNTIKLLFYDFDTTDKWNENELRDIIKSFCKTFDEIIKLRKNFISGKLCTGLYYI